MKKICFVTGTRAEYGLMRNLMHSVLNSTQYELQVIATGTHLSQNYGFTKNEIIADGITVNEEVDILKYGNSKLDVAKSMGLAIAGIAEALDKLQPDLIVLLGDRYECLAAAEAGVVLGIPIAHIHGGEITEGAIDDAFRHSITKMSNFHFVSNETHRKRVIQLGEPEENVFNVGAPGLDNIKKLKYKSKSELFDEYNLDMDKQLFVVTFHPVTIAGCNETVNPLLDVLSKYTDTNIVVTLPNADADSKSIKDEINNWSKEKNNVYVTESLGFLNYLSMVKIADVVIGNSSSGIIEAPMLKVPTVNIGIRQKGRERSPSVLDVDCDANSIANGIKDAIEFKKITDESEYISKYGNGNACTQILENINTLLSKKIVNKKFNDLMV